MQKYWLDLIYLVASVMFIMGIKGLGHPRTAVHGNFISGMGMLIAIVVTIMDRQILFPAFIGSGLLVGTIIGLVMAVRVELTQMPQLVALFNGFGGAASVLVAGAFIGQQVYLAQPITTQVLIATLASGVIGAVTFFGSLIAFAKLQELMSGNPVKFPGQEFANGIFFVVILGAGTWSLSGSVNPIPVFWILTILSCGFGISIVMPVGGADMPVVIALLNSLSGIAAIAVGFVISNSVLIISGSLVGASGLILTRIMCKAMNRSLTNVMLGLIDVGEVTAGNEIYEGRIKSATADEVALLFDDARRVVVVPGYGLAVAQAQTAMRDLTVLLESRNVLVEFAIHPVAGRMPGHMNVLLADANISYDKLREMDDINPSMEKADIVLVVGANDVVNPVARTDPKSPIAGMPIIDADKARSIVVIKRSLSPGYAGIPNPLFCLDNTLMLFGDANRALLDLVAAIKEL